MTIPTGGTGRSTTDETVADRPGDDAQGHSGWQDELRVVHIKIDQAKLRMREAIDLFGLLGFGLAFVGLLVVAGLAAVSFASDDTGVGMLFSALTVVALPIVGIAAWHAFGRLWPLSRELSSLRRREATIFAEAQTSLGVDDPTLVDQQPVRGGPASGVGGLMGGFGRGQRRVTIDRPPPGHTSDGFKEPVPRPGGLGRTAALWLLVIVGVLFLIFVVGVALGAATSN